jgi:cytochrome c553
MERPGAARRAFGRGAVLGCALALAAPAGAAGDPARGAARAAACTSCHGTSERAPAPGLPSLAGQPEAFLVLQMFLIREGLREVPQMAGMLGGFSDRDLEDLAAHFARERPPREDAPRDPALYARGAELARRMNCGGCHGADYRGRAQRPRLAGQREDYLFSAMRAYRDHRRSGADPAMNDVVQGISDAELRALAHYLARLEAARR